MYISGCITLGVSATRRVWVCLNGLVFGYDVTMWVENCYSMCEGVGVNNGQSYYVCGFLHLTLTADVTMSVTVGAKKTVK